MIQNIDWIYTKKNTCNIYHVIANSTIITAPQFAVCNIHVQDEIDIKILKFIIFFYNLQYNCVFVWKKKKFNSKSENTILFNLATLIGVHIKNILSVMYVMLNWIILDKEHVIS